MAPSVKSSDLDRQTVCEQYKPLVLGVISRLPVPYRYREDALQEGSIGLLTAFDRYDNNSPVAFSVFAMNFVKGAVIRGVFVKAKDANPSYIGDVYSIDRVTADKVYDRTEVIVENLELRDWRDSLAGEDRLLIDRMYWGGATSKEISLELGRTQHWVVERHQILLNRARLVLKAS